MSGNDPLATFRSHGYLQVPGFVSGEALGRFFEEAADLTALTAAHFGVTFDQPADDPAERLERQLIQLARGAPQLYKQVCGQLNRLPATYALALDGSLTDIAARMLEDSSITIYSINLIISAPSASWPLDGFHQDSYASEDLHLVANIALTRADAANGGLRVMHGGHTRGFLPHVERPVTAHNPRPHQVLSDERLPFLADRRVLAMQPGDLVLMHRHLPHAGGANRSTGLRLVLAVRYTATRLSLRRHLVVVG